MDFELTDEQRQIRETLDEFAEREIKPHAGEWDKEARFPRHVVEQLGQLGFIGVAFPERWGGSSSLRDSRATMPGWRCRARRTCRCRQGIWRCLVRTPSATVTCLTWLPPRSSAPGV